MKLKLRKVTVEKPKPPGKKGASRLESGKKGFPVQLTLARVLMFAAIMVFGIVFYGSFVAVETVLDVPVNQVEVRADLEFQSKQEITEVINGYVVNGFVRVDLQQLQKELLAMPWIQQASITRKLPHGLVVELAEQKPKAYWNSDAMINSYGEVFYPAEIPAIPGLPKLAGKNDREVLHIYQQLQKLLPENQQPIVSLHVGERNTVNVITILHTELIFNTEKLKEQSLLWSQVASESLGDRLSDVKQADMRYSNGAAVQWKNIVALNNETNRGGH